MFLSLIATASIVSAAPLINSYGQEIQIHNITLNARDSTSLICHGNAATLDGKPDGQFVSCPPAAYQWQVYMPGLAFHDKTCGTGFLDNLRGQCGVISSWGCDQGFTGGENDAYVTFGTTIFCTEKNVQDAFWLAYQQPGLACNLDKTCSDGDDADPSWIIDTIKEALEGLRDL